MEPELTLIFRWWVMLFAIGLADLPLVSLLFSKFLDIGYGFSKSIGILFISYFVFILGTGKIAPFTPLTILIAFALYLFLNIFLFTKNKNKILINIKGKKRTLFAQEIIFTIGYLFWVLVRGYQPDINGLEKFMDFGFVNSILNSRYFPPYDMWFAGSSINYYWFGHFVTALLTKISFIPSSVTYNLMLATIMGLTLIGAFSISSTLTTFINEKIKVRYAFAAGLLSAIMLTYAGNFHTLFFYGRGYYQNFQSTIVCNLNNNCVDEALNNNINYWYPDATRFIGYDPESNDKTIHEFPLYSFVVSDLHAHLLNLPFVLLLIALLSKFVYLNNDLKSKLRNILPIGFLYGIFFMTNTWDVGNYLLVSTITLGLLGLYKHMIDKFDIRKAILKTIYETFVLFIVAICITLAVSLPFMASFKSIAQGIDLVKSATPFWQLLVLWGLPIILIACISLVIIKSKTLTQVKVADIFVLGLLIASILLIMIPEVIYLKDIYSATHHRANTMFKLTYQAFVLSYLVSGYVAIRLTLTAKNKASKIGIIIFFGILFSSLLQYPRFSINSYYAELKNYKGIAGDTWLKNNYPDEYNIVLWLNNNKTGQPTILEAPGDSYTDYNVISAYTGLPTVSGWFVHEWLWRGDSSFPQNRVNDISLIYTSNDIDLTRNLLNKYGVKYIIVGTFERQKYPDLNFKKFESFAKQVFTTGYSIVYEVI